MVRSSPADRVKREPILRSTVRFRIYVLDEEFEEMKEHSVCGATLDDVYLQLQRYLETVYWCDGLHRDNPSVKPPLPTFAVEPYYVEPKEDE